MLRTKKRLRTTDLVKCLTHLYDEDVERDKFEKKNLKFCFFHLPSLRCHFWGNRKRNNIFAQSFLLCFFIGRHIRRGKIKNESKTFKGDAKTKLHNYELNIFLC